MDIDLIKNMSEEEVRAYFEKLRWPKGKTCVFCNNDDLTLVTRKNKPKDIRIRCKRCRKQFTVTAGTILHGTHIPLKKWLLAYYLIKEGTTGEKLGNDISVTYKVAYNLIHRIRGMKLEDLFRIPPISSRSNRQKYFLTTDMCLNWYRVKTEYHAYWLKECSKIDDMSDIVHSFYAEKIGDDPSAIDFYLDDGIRYFFTASKNGYWYLVMSKYRTRYKNKPENCEILNVCVGDTIEYIDFYLSKPAK